MTATVHRLCHNETMHMGTRLGSMSLQCNFKNREMSNDSVRQAWMAEKSPHSTDSRFGVDVHIVTVLCRTSQKPYLRIGVLFQEGWKNFLKVLALPVDSAAHALDAVRSLAVLIAVTLAYEDAFSEEFTFIEMFFDVSREPID